MAEGDKGVDTPSGMQLVEDWRLDDLLDMERRLKAIWRSARAVPLVSLLLKHWERNIR